MPGIVTYGTAGVNRHCLGPTLALRSPVRSGWHKPHGRLAALATQMLVDFGHISWTDLGGWGDLSVSFAKTHLPSGCLCKLKPFPISSSWAFGTRWPAS